MMPRDWPKQACPWGHPQQMEGVPPLLLLLLSCFSHVQPCATHPTLGQVQSSQLLPGACTALPPQAPASLWLCPPSKPLVTLFHHYLHVQKDHILLDSKSAHTMPKTWTWRE